MTINDNIIDMKAFRTRGREYLSTISECKDALDGLEEELMLQAINLAAQGAWQEWDKQIQEGDSFCFTEEMLLDTGDQNVTMIMELKETIGEAVSRLTALLESNTTEEDLE